MLLTSKDSLWIDKNWGYEWPLEALLCDIVSEEPFRTGQTNFISFFQPQNVGRQFQQQRD